MKIVRIAWWGLHFGEEPPLVGNKGAGTIFFTGCNLQCVYCQNYQISQQGIGKNYNIEELVKIMLNLQEMGALNIDLVSPTIWSEQIKEAIIEAKKQGLHIPVIWNSNAYEDVPLLKKLDGLINIYLPDFKYGDDDLAFKYSGIKNYVKKAKKAIQEMLRQVGNKNIIVRHLILPNNIENSLQVLKHLKEIDNNLSISLMSQYQPIYKAKDFPEINRNITKEEFKKVFDCFQELGFKNGWVQEMGSNNVLMPDFTKDNPFN